MLLLWLITYPLPPERKVIVLKCIHTDKNLVVRLGTTWLCNIKRVAVVGMVWAMCIVRHFMLCDQDRELQNVGHFRRNLCDNGLTKMLCAICHYLNIFLSFFTLHRAKFIKKIVVVCVCVGRTTFCMTTTRFMSHNLVVQSCMTKLLSVWTHLEMQKTCKMRHVYGLFRNFMLLHETDFSCLEPSRGRSGNYAREKGIFLCDKG